MKFGVCRAIMGVNSTTNVKYYEGSNTLSSRINRNENQRIIKIIYLTNKLYPKIQMKLYTTQSKIKHTYIQTTPIITFCNMSHFILTKCTL